MNMDNTAQTTEHSISNIVYNIDSSSSTIATDTSSHGLPEVTPAPRSTAPRGLKATLQEQEIARLQAQLQAKEYDEQDIAALKAQLRDREHELTLTQRQVYAIMTQTNSPALDFPEAPPYISFTMDEKIKQMQIEKAKRDKELNEALQYQELQRLTQASPRRTLETPWPHRLHEKAPRLQDIELQHKIHLQSEAEAVLTPTNNSAPLPNNQNLIDVFKQLALVMKENNTSDSTEPAHFNGSDGKWDEFYSQLRTYLSAKDWLITFEHPVGPGAPGFNNEVNKKIYNKLLMLCKSGHAVTYVKKAAEFDGHGAGRQLLLRYDGLNAIVPYEKQLSNYATSTEQTWQNTLIFSKRSVDKWHTTVPTNPQPKNRKLTGS
jgi:hypothetical protein